MIPHFRQMRRPARVSWTMDGNVIAEVLGRTEGGFVAGSYRVLDGRWLSLVALYFIRSPSGCALFSDGA